MHDTSFKNIIRRRKPDGWRSSDELAECASWKGAFVMSFAISIPENKKQDMITLYMSRYFRL